MKVYFLLVLCLLEFVTAHDNKGSQKCRFPVEWRGRYFQSGLGEITVKDSLITTKGTCLEQKRDYYLLDNRDSGCYYCLLVLSQHRNILQYKESHCTTQADFETVCAQIKVETPLFTLIREQATPIACPFTDFYHFDYNDLDRGYCQEKTSVASPCSSASRYRLKFRHCKRQAVYDGKDIEMECLATWKDGSEAYLYARLIADGIEEQDDKYRCLKYHNYGNDVTLSMSVDATCIGLRSPTDGPFLMAFNRVEPSNEQSSPCRFPDWFRDMTWRDLTGQLKIYADESLAALIQKGRRHGTSGQSKEHVQTIHRCRWFLTKSSNEDSDIYIYKSYSSQDCDSQHQCFRLHRTKHNILTVSEGYFDNVGDPFQACSNNSTYTRHQYFMPLNGSGSSCPRPGVHHTRPTDLCVYRLNMGCAAPSFISIDHSCSADQPSVLLECLASWSDELSTRNYVMVRHRTDNTILCYSFRRENNSDLFGVDPLCPFNQGSVTSQLMKTNTITSYSIDRHETCKTRVPIPRLSGQPHAQVTRGPHLRIHATEPIHLTIHQQQHQKHQSQRRKILSPNSFPTKQPTFHQKPLSSSAIPLGTITSFFSFSKEDDTRRFKDDQKRPVNKHRDPFVIVGGDDDDDFEDEDEEEGGEGEYGSGRWFETTLVGRKRGTEMSNQERTSQFYNSNNSVRYGTHQEDNYDQEFYAQWHGLGSRKGVLRSHDNRYPTNKHHDQQQSRTTSQGPVRNPSSSSFGHQGNRNNMKHGRVAIIDGNQFKQSSSFSSSSSSSSSSFSCTSSSPFASILSAIAATPHVKLLPRSIASYLYLAVLPSFMKSSELIASYLETSRQFEKFLHERSIINIWSSVFEIKMTATKRIFRDDHPNDSSRDVMKERKGTNDWWPKGAIDQMKSCNAYNFHRVLQHLASVSALLPLITLTVVLLLYRL